MVERRLELVGSGCTGKVRWVRRGAGRKASPNAAKETAVFAVAATLITSRSSMGQAGHHRWKRRSLRPHRVSSRIVPTSDNAIHAYGVGW